MKPCTCSAQRLQKASAPWTFLLALLFGVLALLPSVIPPENLGSHKEFSVEPGSVCASRSVCRCQSSQLWSRILYSVLHSLVSSKKEKKKSPNNTISPHSSGCWNPSTHQMTPQPSHSFGYRSQQPCPTRFTCFSPQRDSTISCVCISSTLSHYQLHYILCACSHIALKVFFFPLEIHSQESWHQFAWFPHGLPADTQLWSVSGPASVITFHRSHADVTYVFYTGGFYFVFL